MRVLRFIIRCYMPFSFFDEDYILDWLQPSTELTHLPISSITAPIYLTELTDAVSNVIKQRVHEGKVCLKLDYIVQNKFAVLSINIIYIRMFVVHTHMIGALELNDPNVCGNLNGILCNRLEEFNIDKSQLYCIILANGEHTLKTIEVREMFQEVGINDHVQVDSIYNYERVYDELSEQMPIIHCIPDAMEMIANKVYTHFKGDIEETEKIIKTIHVDLLAKEQDVKMPFVENMPSWYTSYKLMRTVTRWKCTKDSKLLLTLNWNFIENYCTAFNTIVTHIKWVCTVECIIGDFYREWLMCENALENTCESNLVAQIALTLMQEHRKEFFKNSQFLAALYIDPRFTNKWTTFLNDDQQCSAMEDLTKTYYELNSVNQIELTVIDTQSQSDKYNTLYTKAVKQNTQEEIDKIAIRQNFSLLRFRESLAFSESVLNYFKQLENPVMYKLAEVVLSFPIWQTTMRNAHKALPSIAKRQNLNQTPEDLKRILLLKFNLELI